MVNRIDGPGKNEGYNKIKLYDEGTKETKTFLVPVGKKVTYGNTTYDLDKAKNNEFVITGKKDQAAFKLTGIALEHLDTNKDGKIDENDNNPDLAKKVNKDLKDTNYFVKDGPYSDAGITKGTGGVVFSRGNEGQVFGIEIE